MQNADGVVLNALKTPAVNVLIVKAATQTAQIIRAHVITGIIKDLMVGVITVHPTVLFVTRQLALSVLIQMPAQVLKIILAIVLLQTT